MQLKIRGRNRLRVCVVLAVLAILGVVSIVSLAVLRPASQPMAVPGSFDAGFWATRVREVGAMRAYGEFARSIQNIPILTQHQDAHEFGRVLYQTIGLDGFAACDSQFSSGCYHELVGSALAKLGTAASATLNQKCIEALGPSGATPCQHGIGHGLMAYFGYTLDGLTQSLAICRSLKTEDETRGCFGGVYMEYNFATMAGVTGYARPQTADAYDPCDKLDPAYQPSCYFWQPQWWQDAFLAAQRLSMKKASQAACADYEHAQQIPACASWLATYRVAFKFLGERCMALKTPANVRACMSGVGYEALPETDYDEEAAAQLCADASSDPGYREICDFYTEGENGGPPVDHF